jgi:hypothetical protein
VGASRAAAAAASGAAAAPHTALERGVQYIRH